MESGEHVCPNLTDEQSTRPSLQKQFSISQFTDSSSSIQPAASDEGKAEGNRAAAGEVRVEAGVCPLCGKPTNEYPEEVVAIATVVVGTCCHRLPHIVSGYLVSRIIPAVAR